MDDDVDIYDDLPSFNINECTKCKERSTELFDNHVELEKEKIFWKVKCENLEKEKKTILANSSSLMKTARAEIGRKDNIILELRRELEDFKFKRGVFWTNKTNRTSRGQGIKLEKKIQRKEMKVDEMINNRSSPYEISNEAKEEEEDDVEQKYDPNVKNSTLYGERLRRRLLLEQEAEKKERDEAKDMPQNLLITPNNVEKIEIMRFEENEKKAKETKDAKNKSLVSEKTSRESLCDEELNKLNFFEKFENKVQERKLQDKKIELADGYFCSGGENVVLKKEDLRSSQRNSISRNKTGLSKDKNSGSSEKNVTHKEERFERREENNLRNCRESCRESRYRSRHDHSRHSRDAYCNNSNRGRKFQLYAESDRRSMAIKKYDRRQENRSRDRSSSTAAGGYTKNRNDFSIRDKYDYSKYNSRDLFDLRAKIEKKIANASKDDRQIQIKSGNEKSSLNSKKIKKRSEESKCWPSKIFYYDNKIIKNECDDKQSKEKFDSVNSKGTNKNSGESEIAKKSTNFEESYDESKKNEKKYSKKEDKFVMMLENDSEVATSPLVGRPEVESAVGSRSFREEKIENIEKFIQEYEYFKEEAPPNEEQQEGDCKMGNSTSSIVETLGMDDIVSDNNCSEQPERWKYSIDAGNVEKKKLLHEIQENIFNNAFGGIVGCSYEKSQDTSIQEKLEIVEGKPGYHETDDIIDGPSDNIFQDKSNNFVIYEKSEINEITEGKSERLAENVNLDVESDDTKMNGKLVSLESNMTINLVDSSTKNSIDQISTYINIEDDDNNKCENDNNNEASLRKDEKSVVFPMVVAPARALTSTLEKEATRADKNIFSKSEVEKKNKMLLKQFKNRPRIPCLPIVSLYSGKRRNLVLVDSAASQTIVKPLQHMLRDKIIPTNAKHTFQSSVEVMKNKTSLAQQMEQDEIKDCIKSEDEIKVIINDSIKSTVAAASEQDITLDMDKKVKEDSPVVIIPTLLEKKKIESEKKSRAEPDKRMESCVQFAAAAAADSKKRAQKVSSVFSKNDVLPDSSNRKRGLTMEKENHGKPSKRSKVVLMTRRRAIRLVDSSTVTTLVSSQCHHQDQSEKDIKLPPKYVLNRQ